MTSLEERVAALETRVEELAAHSEHATDLAVTAAREALTAREAHQRNIELLNALRKTQAEHTQLLAEHGHRLDSIDAKLEDLDGIKGSLGVLTAGMHTLQLMLGRLVEEDTPDT